MEDILIAGIFSTTGVVIGIVLFAIAIISNGIVIVRQSEVVVIERLGKYKRTLKPGINIIIPIFDKPKEIEWRYTKRVGDRTVIEKKQVSRIDLRETVYDFPKQNVITKDNVVIEINALLYFQITDPVKAVYEIANLPEAIEKLTQTTLRNIIGEMDLDETLVSRDKINHKLRDILDEATDKWGVKVNRVELQDINPPKDIRDAMEKQMRAERDKRAAILEAEGLKQSKILEAEGIKQAAIKKAEGEAEARKKVAEAEAKAIEMVTNAVAISGGNPTNYLIALKYIETLKEMVSGKNNKVIYLPYEASALLGSVGSIKEMFDKFAVARIKSSKAKQHREEK